MPNRLRDKNIEDSFVSDLVGLPARSKSAPKVRTNIDPTGFGSEKDVGFFSTTKQTKAATEGIKDTGTALASEFRGLRPKPKKAVPGLSPTSEEAPTEGGGFVSFQGSGKKNLPQAVANFGLPTDRLPTIDELGGALGGIAKFVSSLTKRNRARGLSPGTAIKKQVDKGAVGLQKTKLDALSKLREGDILAGDKDKAAERALQIEALISGNDANAFDESEDINAILGL